MVKSRVCIILKNKEIIKGAGVAKGVTVLTKRRSQTMEEVEKLLLIWLNEKHLIGDSISETIICDKAKKLHADHLKNTPRTSADTFKASREWFEKFRKRNGIHSVVRQGEGARQKQTSLDKFLVRNRSSESQAGCSGAKRQKREKSPEGKSPDFLWKVTQTIITLLLSTFLTTFHLRHQLSSAQWIGRGMLRL
ncbi:uncharacterized protein LOC143244827 [Tachypleus tridentatus]|uniref:uncharacterized protein LOC143244827 n=1 Tax=Tachypleus tridentatus TaxID=6853 RepID=UPI003FCFC3C8